MYKFVFQECAKNDAAEFSSQLYFRVSRSCSVEESIEVKVTVIWWMLSEIANDYVQYVLTVVEVQYHVSAVLVCAITV